MFNYLAAPGTGGGGGGGGVGGSVGGGGRRASTPGGAGFGFQPQQQQQRASFIPLKAARDELSGAFMADLPNLRLPPVADAKVHAFNCNVCRVELSGRPRIRCMECHIDICSTCYWTRNYPQSHRGAHKQQTLRPRDYPVLYGYPRVPEYFCDCCYKDLVREPRARCVECKNYDICLDCLSVGETSLKHRTTHLINIINPHTLPTGPILMGADNIPTPLLEKLIDALFDYIDSTFPPRHTHFLEPSKLSAAFSHLGVVPSKNLFRTLSYDAISDEFTRAGVEYHFTCDSAEEIAARKKPWVVGDKIDTTPRAPSLTRRGWMRWFVFEIWKDTDLMHFVLSNALATGMVMNKRKGEPYRINCPRDCFPRVPQVSATRGKEWEGGGDGGRERRRTGSRPGSRSASRPASRGA